MANRHKGEVSLDIDGRIYTLAVTMNAMVALEELFSTASKDVTFQEIASRAEAGSMRHNRALVWALFQKHHAEEVKTPADVSDLIDRAGGILALGTVLQQVVGAGQPDAQDAKALGVPDPRPAQADAKRRGTGARSTSAPGAPA